MRLVDCAGLLYSPAKALLSLPSASELVHGIINALEMNGGQRFASQAGEAAGGHHLSTSLAVSWGKVQ